MTDRTVSQEASAYFNALSIEQRRKLEPLLEEYRRMGMLEYARAMNRTGLEMRCRISGLAAHLDAPIGASDD